MIMKNKILYSLLAICFLLFISANAQEKVKTAITSIKLKDKTVELTVVSAKPFIVGGNMYLLYIGDKKFQLSRQSKKDGKGILTFLIPYNDFTQAKEGANIWMFYGDYILSDGNAAPDFDALLKENPRTCWSLGKLKKKSLKK